MTASRIPAATHRTIICPPRQRVTWRVTWRVRLMRRSAAFVVARDCRSRAERSNDRIVTTFLQAFAHAGGRAGVLGLQPARQVPQQAGRRRDVGAVVRAAHDGLHPGPLTLGEVLEDIPQLVDWAALDESDLAEHRRDGFSQGLRTIEDHEQAAVGSQAPALQIRKQALTERGVFGRAFPAAEGVSRPIGTDPQGHDHTMLTNVDAIEHQAHQIEPVERRRLPRRQLRGCLRDEASTDRALADASTCDAGRERVQTPRIPAGTHAEQQLLHRPTLQRVGLAHRLTRRQRDLLTAGPHTRAPNPDLAAAEHHFLGTVPARDAVRSA